MNNRRMIVASAGFGLVVLTGAATAVAYQVPEIDPSKLSASLVAPLDQPGTIPSVSAGRVSVEGSQMPSPVAVTAAPGAVSAASVQTLTETVTHTVTAPPVTVTQTVVSEIVIPGPETVVRESSPQTDTQPPPETSGPQQPAPLSPDPKVENCQPMDWECFKRQEASSTPSE